MLKVCALESRLGTRQLSEELQKRLCDEIGATFGKIQNERQKFVQEVVNGILSFINFSYDLLFSHEMRPCWAKILQQ